MKRKGLVLILSALLAFTAAFAVNISAVQSNSIVAYAASLTAPSVTVKSASYNSAKLSWKKVGAAKKYIVYRSTKKSSGYKAVKTITKNSTVSFTDAKLTCGKTYYYKVASVNGSKKKYSSVKSVKIIPQTPSSFSVSSSKCGYNTVKYSAVSGASGYQIYYSAQKSGTYKCIKTTTAKSYSHNIGAGKAGYYKVRAYRTVNGKKVYSAFSAVKGKTAMKHSFEAYYVTKEATCATAGQKVATCKTCGAKSVASIPADPIFYDHEYTDYTVTTLPTCTANGIETKTCRLCGKKVNRGIAPLGHDYGEYTVTTAATCEAAGVETSYCSRCDSTQTRETAATGHSWQQVYTVDIKPTCTKSGVRSIHCDNCSQVKDEESIDPLGHSYTGAGVHQKGETHSRSCINCGTLSPETEPCEYNYTILKEPSKKEAGLGLYTCRYCPNSFEVAIDKLSCEHPNSSIVVINVKNPTCTEKGYTGDQYCNDCNSITTPGTEIVASGHNYETVTVPASCTQQGCVKDVCTRCESEVINKYLPVIPHTVTQSYAFNDTGEFCYICESCQGKIPTTICTINLNDAENINYLGVAEYNSLTNKLVLTGSALVTGFELEGDTSVSITVNATVDTEVKLCGVNITTEAANCIKTNNKAAIYEVTGLKPLVTVSVSAKDGTVNTLTANTSGNAIDSETKLILKGHGVLNANTTSTAINCIAKLEIKNLTLNITSGNRGIDTKNLIPMLDVNGDPVNDTSGNQLYDEEFYNIEFGANAIVTVNSYDDGIRCKNMTFGIVDKALGDTDSTVKIVSTVGDGIQVEGKTGIAMNSGVLTITAGKRAFNCASNLLVINTDTDGNPLGSYTVISCTEEFKP